ncbi:unnamed protein product [Phyllotreta striolata]|uniref:Uncharacterized protein n=1 Tax=Phyllotreta striolata TaxID=444603 RepID=A0A9N9XP56_PHYSR|nr:unnamed protein product [Phyllotreta striolata]
MAECKKKCSCKKKGGSLFSIGNIIGLGLIAGCVYVYNNYCIRPIIDDMLRKIEPFFNDVKGTIFKPKETSNRPLNKTPKNLPNHKEIEDNVDKDK